ncbi:hypothetical protein SNE40_021385 [Patella caerulea]|uniref:Uncharacterized protein n=1 Tax=Patella caerulea TaxID=87958 RepID=A0AAN8G496_PATCE
MQSHMSINSDEVSSANNIVRVPCATGCIDIRVQNRTSGSGFENCSSSFDSRRKRHRCISSSSVNQVEGMSSEYRETDGLLSSTRYNRSVELQHSADHTNPNLTDSNSSHCHDASERSEIDKKARTKLIIASLLCLIFMVGEMAGGLIAHSLAIISDAAHLLTDFASFMISLLALYLASRRATKKLSFGWYRVEILGALISILMLWVLTGILVYSAVNRIIDKSYEIDATVMLITASCGVAFNLALGFTLHQGGHTHSHLGGGHSHNTKHSQNNHSHGNKSINNGHHDNHDNHANSSPEEIRVRYGSIDEEANGDYVRFKNADESQHRHSNINVKAAFVHVIGDLCQSIGVLIAALIIYFKPEWKMADPICTFLFSIFVIVTTITILRDILVVLMEGTPRHLIFTDVRDAFYEVEGVKDIHNLRVWSLTMDKTALSVHIAVYKDADPLKVLKTASGMIQSKFDIKETTMQIEEYVPEMLDCTYCQDLKD